MRTLRTLLAGLLALVGLLVTALVVLTVLQLQGSSSQTEAQNRRTTSVLLAESMRQSSDDLTMMVRLYVSTGDPRYRGYYDQILGIRSGDLPRPEGYNGSFWDRVLGEGPGFVSYGPPRSLVDQMRAARFDPAELDALNSALETSDRLATLELAVMDDVAPRIARGVDAGYATDVATDYRRLVDAGYLAEKATIMGAVDRFIALVEQRTRAEVDAAGAHNRLLARIQLGVLAAGVLIGAAAMVILSRVAVRPLGALTSTTRRITGGDYAERAAVGGVAELREVASAFNEMAAAVQEDVAARQEAERDAVQARLAAEHANRAKSTFLAAMSHEIRTPMIGVTGMLEVLARSELSPQQRHMVATAESSAQALLQIIGDILDFSRIEADKLELAPGTFDLAATVAAAVDTFVHTASAKGLLLTRTDDDALARAHVGDALRVRQIVSNLLSNAVKFTAVGGIAVATRVLEERDGAQVVEVAVTDTGPGIAEAEQERLFVDFAQAAGTSGGSGLGLVICRRLATLMAGDVTMASRPGHGTTMRLTVPLTVGDPGDLPAAAPARRAGTRPRPSREQAVAEGSLLLLAEDHPVNRTVLMHQLDVVGFEVDIAEDGEQAWQLFRSRRYGAVLTDLNMPRRDGYALAAAIRSHEAATGATRTPIIALTANVMSGEPERCAAVGMDDFAAKPTTIPVLAAKLLRWLPDLAWPEATEIPAAPAVNGYDPAGYDTAALAELTGGDTGLATAILADFETTTQADLDDLAAATAAGDVTATRRIAHRIKGAARMVGAGVVAALAQRIESDPDGADVAAHVRLLRAALGALRAVDG